MEYAEYGSEYAWIGLVALIVGVGYLVYRYRAKAQAKGREMYDDATDGK